MTTTSREGVDPPPPEPAPPRPLAPPVKGQVMFVCPKCGHGKRFISTHAPEKDGRWSVCAKCTEPLGMYVVDDGGYTWLRLAATA